jgi:hypothetical protein
VQKFKFVIFGSIAALVVIGGLSSVIVQAAPPESKIYGCVTGVNGNITQVKMTPHTCPAKSTPIEWSVGNSEASQGPKGDTGLQGPAGEPGAQGIQGLKGDPGYSYEEALASIDNADSNVQSVMFGADGCVGPDFIRYAGDPFQGKGSQSICARTFHNLSSFKVLSVKTSPLGGNAMKIYIAPAGCSNTFESLNLLKTARNLKGYLIENALPFKLVNSSEVSCLFMFAIGDEGMYQVVYSTN